MGLAGLRLDLVSGLTGLGHTQGQVLGEGVHSRETGEESKARGSPHNSCHLLGDTAGGTTLHLDAN